MTQADHMKPLFIPLKGEYYDLFAAGVKGWEYRAYGARWNERTCTVGRNVVLSRGYGKKHRLNGRVEHTMIMKNPTRDFVKIYGADKQCFAIKIQVSAAPSTATSGE